MAKAKRPGPIGNETWHGNGHTFTGQESFLPFGKVVLHYVAYIISWNTSSEFCQKINSFEVQTMDIVEQAIAKHAFKNVAYKLGIRPILYT